MTKQPTSDYQEVDRRFDEKFYYSEESGLRVWDTEKSRILGHKASVRLNGRRLKSWLHSELDRVREETIKECLETVDDLWGAWSVEEVKEQIIKALSREITQLTKDNK